MLYSQVIYILTIYILIEFIYLVEYIDLIYILNIYIYMVEYIY